MALLLLLLLLLLLNGVATATASTTAAETVVLPSEVSSSRDTVLMKTKLEKGEELAVDFPLDVKSQFAFVQVNVSGVQGGLSVGESREEVVPLIKTSARPFVFTRSSHDYSGEIMAACQEEARGEEGPCRLVLRIRPEERSVSVPMKLIGFKGELIELGTKQVAKLSHAGARRMFGLELRDENLPALITLRSYGSGSAWADFDLEVYAFQELISGHGPAFQKKFPIAGQVVSSDQILVHSVQTSFLRVDVISRSDISGIRFSLQVDANYSTFDLYTVSLVGTIGAACLLALCLSGSMCILMARRQVLNSSSAPSVELPRQSGGVDGDYLKKLPCEKFCETNMDSEDATCAICIDEYSSEDRIRSLPCHHHFHDACISKWLQNSKLCPLCQRVLGPATSADSIQQA